MRRLRRGRWSRGQANHKGRQECIGIGVDHIHVQSSAKVNALISRVVPDLVGAYSRDGSHDLAAGYVDNIAARSYQTLVRDKGETGSALARGRNGSRNIQLDRVKVVDFTVRICSACRYCEIKLPRRSVPHGLLDAPGRGRIGSTVIANRFYDGISTLGNESHKRRRV